MIASQTLRQRSYKKFAMALNWGQHYKHCKEILLSAIKASRHGWTWELEDAVSQHFFDIVVTNTNDASQLVQTLSYIYHRHEQGKRKLYNSRELEIEHGFFTPLVFSVTGGMGQECSKFHNHPLDRIAGKTEQRYEKVISWITCKLSFTIMRSALLCLRGSCGRRVAWFVAWLIFYTACIFAIKLLHYGYTKNAIDSFPNWRIRWYRQGQNATRANLQTSTKFTNTDIRAKLHYRELV